MVSLIGRVPVGIGIWIEQEIGTIEAVHKGRIVRPQTVRIEQFTRVEGVVTGGLQPNGEEVLVEPLCDEFGVSSYATLALRPTPGTDEGIYHKAASHPSHWCCVLVYRSRGSPGTDNKETW